MIISITKTTKTTKFYYMTLHLNKYPFHEDILHFIKHYAMKIYRGVQVQLDAILTSALHTIEQSASHPGHTTPWENGPGTHSVGAWVDPRDQIEEIPGPVRD
jgi:hypothetical protein